MAEFKQVDKILIRSTNWIGDAVMTTPAMGAVRAAYPHAEIVVAANPAVSELFAHHPYCDRVLIFDKRGAHRGLSGFFGFCRDLRMEKFDLAVLFQNAIEAAVMAFFARIPQRAGYRTDGRGFLLTHGVRIGKAERRMHHTDYYLVMLRKLGIGTENGELKLYCRPEEIVEARCLLGEDRRWVAINPGAAYGSAKRWFPERFAEVADAVSKDLDARIVLIGGSGETEIGAAIESAMRDKPLNLIGKTSVRLLMAVISQSFLMITNDSGPMHVAAAFDIPIVALFGPTDHTTTSPRSRCVEIVRKDVECAPCLKRFCPTDHRCMKGISVKDVVDAVKRMGLTSDRKIV
ncbi:MAG: lipopolysaccharide heptosyltransferase II [Syntrophobacteraceae bacterium]